MSQSKPAHSLKKIREIKKLKNVFSRYREKMFETFDIVRITTERALI